MAAALTGARCQAAEADAAIRPGPHAASGVGILGLSLEFTNWNKRELSRHAPAATAVRFQPGGEMVSYRVPQYSHSLPVMKLGTG
jgi:hypothetical protein